MELTGKNRFADGGYIVVFLFGKRIIFLKSRKKSLFSMKRFVGMSRRSNFLLFLGLL